MVLPGARTSSEQCLRHSFESLPSTGKAGRIFHVPQSAKTRRRIRSARSESVAPKQSRCPACRKLWGQIATNKHQLIHLHTHQYAHPHTPTRTSVRTHTHPYAHLTHTSTHTCIHTRTRTHTAHNYFKANMNLHQRAPLQGFPALWNQETCSKNTQFHE